ncbi:MAG TPA: hypothetical protein PKH10_02380 [bacterium]|nr:hypothetical protein [bacterium]
MRPLSALLPLAAALLLAACSNSIARPADSDAAAPAADDTISDGSGGGDGERDEIAADAAAGDDLPVVDEEADAVPDADPFVTLERTTVQWGTPADDYLVDLAADGSGGYYVAGSSGGALPGCANAGAYDLFLIRFAADGTRAWSRELGTALDDHGYSIVRGKEGLVSVGGVTFGVFDGAAGAGGLDLFIATWQADGTPAGLQQWGTAVDDRLSGMAGDGSGGFILLSGDALSQRRADGSEVWSKPELLPFNHFYDLTTAPDGTLLLAGVEQYPATRDRNNHCAVTAVDTEGALLWSRTTYSPEYCTAVALSPAGDIYAIGYADQYDGAPVEGDILLVKFNAAAEQQWTVPWGTEANDEGRNILTDQKGDIYLLGTTERIPPEHPAAVGRDILLLKFSQKGTPLWMAQWGSDQDDGPGGMFIDPQGRLVVAGYTAGSIDGNPSAGGVDMFISAITLPE